MTMKEREVRNDWVAGVRTIAVRFSLVLSLIFEKKAMAALADWTPRHSNLPLRVVKPILISACEESEHHGDVG